MIVDFFKEDFSEVIGAYYDGEKIFLARHLNGTKDFAEEIFSPDKDISEIEQLAEKIFVMCSKRGWRTSKVGFCLREGTAITFQSPLNVPIDEIDDAVKSWALAHVGKEVLFTSLKFDGEIWMEAIQESTVAEFVDAWQKNSMNLCALTAKPQFNDENLTPAESAEFNESAEFVADIVANLKAPNLLKNRLNVLNYKKISAVIVAIFFCALLGFSAKLAAEYYKASAQFEAAQAEVALYQNDFATKDYFESQVVELLKINDFCAAQVSSPIFPALVKLGTIADGKTSLNKLNFSHDSMEIEGTTDDPNEIESYTRRLKKFFARDIRTGNLSSNDTLTLFTLTLKNFY